MQARVLVVEDEPLTRMSLVGALKQAGLDVVGDAATPADAIRIAETTNPNVALLDLHLGSGPTGIDIAQALRRKDPTIGIVFLTSYSDPRLLNTNLPALPSGATYLEKKSIDSIEKLQGAIEKSHENRKSGSTASAVPTFGNLTATQIDTLKLVAQGLSNAEIAKRRFVKEKSIEVAISRIAKALGISADQAQNQRVHIANVYFRAIGMNKDA